MSDRRGTGKASKMTIFIPALSKHKYTVHYRSTIVGWSFYFLHKYDSGKGRIKPGNPRKVAVIRVNWSSKMTFNKQNKLSSYPTLAYLPFDMPEEV